MVRGLLWKSLSPGNLVDGLPGALHTKAIRGFQGLRGQRLSMILGQKFDSLEMFLIITCANILEKLKDILKIMLRDDVDAWNDKEIQILYSR